MTAAGGETPPELAGEDARATLAMPFNRGGGSADSIKV